MGIDGRAAKHVPSHLWALPPEKAVTGMFGMKFAAI
jgi:hypothetical protein